MVRVAVVGAGPAGFYAARALLRRGVNVDLLEALPVPFGLVRYGVAPDHPDTKRAIHGFTDLVRNSAGRIRFRGNLRIDTGVPITSDYAQQPPLALHHLKEMYPLVVSATGAAHPRQLPANVENVGDARGRVGLAHDFISWLNGHPYWAKSSVSLPKRHGSVAVVGAGNVALDCARLLLRSPCSLRATDISPIALNALEDARVRKVDIFVRRRPRDAAWTTAALRELVAKFNDIHASVATPDILQEDLETDDISRSLRRRLQLLANLRSGSKTPRRGNLLQFNFGLSPQRIAAGNDDVGIDFAYNVPGSSPSSSASPFRPFSVPETRRVGLALLSLGYVGGTESEGCEVRVGWANGKGTGIIGDNMVDAESVIASLSDRDLGLVDRGHRSMDGTAMVDEWAKQASLQLVDWEGWERIDQEERRRGPRFCPGRERVKIESVEEMLDVAGVAGSAC